MFTKPQTLGAGDYLSRDEIAVKIGATAAIVQSTGALTNPNVIEVGRCLVPDILNVRGETAANRAGLSGVISDLGDLATWILPAAAAQVIRRVGVVLNQNTLPGGTGVLQLAGPTRVLCSDTQANLPNGALVTVAFAATNARGTVRLAATGEAVVGMVLDLPRNAAGVATDGTAAVPQFIVIDFFGNGTFNRLSP